MSLTKTQTTTTSTNLLILKASNSSTITTNTKVQDADLTTVIDVFTPQHPPTPSPPTSSILAYCPPRLLHPYQVATANHALSLSPPRRFYDVTEHPRFNHQNSYEQSAAYINSKSEGPRKIEGIHWRVKRRLEKDDPDWTEFMPDGTRIVWRWNEFGESMPVEEGR